MMEDLERCPNCGKEKLWIAEEPNFKEGVVNKRYSCFGCDGDLLVGSYRPTKNKDRYECRICGALFMPEERGGTECHHCDKKKTGVWIQHEFGIIVPERTGVIYKHQTDGMMCRKTFIEGSFIPIRRPTAQEYRDNEIDEKYVFDGPFEDGDMLRALRRANYNKNDEKADDIWNDIDDNIRFEYEEVDAPDDMPKNTEGIKWIRITDGGSMFDERLEGETVCMIYPNCD